MPNLQTLNSVEINYNWTRNQFYQNFLCRQWKLIFLALFEPLNELPLTKSNNYFYLLAYLLRPNKFNGTGTRNAATIILRGDELQKFEETVKNDPDLSEFDLFAFEVTSASDEDTQFNIEFCAICSPMYSFSICSPIYSFYEYLCLLTISIYSKI